MPTSARLRIFFMVGSFSTGFGRGAARRGYTSAGALSQLPIVTLQTAPWIPVRLLHPALEGAVMRKIIEITAPMWLVAACASSTHSTVSDSTVSVAQECTRNGGWWRPQLGAMRNAIETIITAETAAHLCRDSDTG